MEGMILHKGGRVIDRHQLAQVETPEPTKTHMPVPHMALLDQVYSALTTIDVHPVAEKLAIAKNGARFFGTIELKRTVEDGRGYNVMLGLRNSHDKTFSAEFVTGSRVFVCDNLAFSGSFLLSRKHTLNVMRDLPELVMRGVAQAQAAFIEQDRRLDAYRERHLFDYAAHDLMIEMMRQEVFGPVKLKAVVDQWHDPKYVEHASDGHTVWRLMNAVTEVLKDGAEAPNPTLPRRTVKMHALLDVYCGLTPLKEAA